MTMTTTADALDTPDETEAPPQRRSAAYRLGVVLLVGAPFMTYALWGSDERRMGAMPATLFEIAVWLGLLFTTMSRNPRGELRLSDPFVSMLVMFVNFFILPAITWLHGAELDRSWGEAGRFHDAEVARLQYLHVLFMVSLTFAYYLIAPRAFPRRLSEGLLKSTNNAVAWMLGLGVAQTLIGVATRLASGGGLRQNRTYGDSWFAQQDDIQNSRSLGGSNYFVTQVLSKIWYLPLMALGVANGILLVRALETRSRVRLVLVMAQVPLLLLLGTGGRSAVFIPFIVSFVIADVLRGPLRWRWLGLLALVGSLIFGFFGQYRVYQDRGFGEATEMASQQFSETGHGEGLAPEGSIMLVKENFGIRWVDMNQTHRGASYFIEIFLGILPSQLVPSKGEWMNTASFISRSLLGRQADAGAGLAGAVLVDGYMVADEFGIVLVAMLLGSMLAVVVRWMLSYNPRRASGPAVWRVLLLMTFAGQAVAFIRSDPGAVFSGILYYVAAPALFISLGLRSRPDSVWNTPVELER